MIFFCVHCKICQDLVFKLSYWFWYRYRLSIILFSRYLLVSYHFISKGTQPYYWLDMFLPTLPPPPNSMGPVLLVSHVHLLFPAATHCGRETYEWVVSVCVCVCTCASIKCHFQILQLQLGKSGLCAWSGCFFLSPSWVIMHPCFVAPTSPI